MAGGGAERQLAYLAAELGRLGCRVHVALTRRGANWARLNQSGAVIHEMPAPSAYDGRLFARLRRVVRAVNPDIIQVWLLQMEVLGGLAALSSGKPWILSERASADAYPPSLKHFLRTRIARFATAITANSKAGDEYWRARVGHRVRRRIIPNAVPVPEIAAAPIAPDEAIGFDSAPPLVLFAGRLEPQKNIDTLLAALETVLARTDACVLCCGEGSLRSRVDDWIHRQAAIDRVKIMGYASDLWGLMKRASVVVSPSRFEGSPNVVLEAMACGVPLVVSDIPEHRELLDETSAVLVPAMSAERLADAIVETLRDRVAAASRAQVAREQLARYRLSAIAQQYIELYRELLTARAAI